MIETLIMLKPRDQWRPGMRKADIIAELNAKMQIPGVTNGWTQPIIPDQHASTGVRTDVGLKIYGQQLDTIYAVAQRLKKALVGIDGVKDLYVEPITGGKYLDVSIKRDALGRYGLTVDDVNAMVETAIGACPSPPPSKVASGSA
ncbi:MAG: efflux RND transporter permease subunit [Flavobacteriales bacterium]|nr:efflux RND transporter permease subunit [Flavobacteriales bacterium]